MQIERLRNGLELFNKINGQRYKVTEVSGGIGKAVKCWMTAPLRMNLFWW